MGLIYTDTSSKIIISIERQQKNPMELLISLEQ